VPSYSIEQNTGYQTRHRFAILAVFLTLGCGVAWLSYVAYHITHRGEGPLHSYPVAGNAALTDAEAISLAKQTLQRDGRFSGAMELETFGNGRVVNRGEDKSYVSLCWRYPGTNDRWFVQLHRTPDRVDAVSYPGK